MQSFEPGEDWFWSYAEETYLEGGPELAPPQSHPPEQPVPGPAGGVPRDWRCTSTEPDGAARAASQRACPGRME